MNKTAILCDSCSDIPAELLEKYNIDMLNFHIVLDGVDYIERESFTNDEFYNMMRSAQGVPTTAAINIIEFTEKFCEYVDANYDNVIYFSMNKGGSATHNNAIMAIDMVCEERPNHKTHIHVIDSRTYSMTYGWYICELARKIRNGGDVKIAIAEFKDKMTKAEIILGPYSLKQMKKSGRISAAAAFAGELLGLRPIITLIDGETKVNSKVRGDEKVIPAMLNLCKERTTNAEDFEYMIGYTDMLRVNDLVRAASKQFGKEPVTVFKLGGVVSANTGPDVLALVYLGEKR